MPNKAIFLDRDNTLIKDPGYINSSDQVKLLEGVADALSELKGMGYKLIVVSNQSAVARGIVTEKVLGKIHKRLEQLLIKSGASLDRIYYCPCHPDGVIAKYRKESYQRKPKPGMLLVAAEDMDIDLNCSWMIGNSSCDVEAGANAGCKTILIDSCSHDKQSVYDGINPDYKAVNIKEAVNIIKKHNRTFAKTTAQTQSDPPPQRQSNLRPHGESYQPKPRETQKLQPEQDMSPQRTEQLLSDILEQLKRAQRADMFGEFSIMRLLAGVLQAIVAFCLLISVWFLTSPPPRQVNSIFISLGFAVVFQIMALTFYVMQGRK